MKNMTKNGFIAMTIILSSLYVTSARSETPEPVADNTIYTDSTTRSEVATSGNMTTTIRQPPPSAISPQFSSGSNSDLCTIGVAGAVQTQILGISAGTTFTEENCIRLKNAKVLYDMGMKVAAVSVMCQDPKVFDAMMHAGTPCPYNGQIGDAARLGWETHVETTRQELEESDGLNVKETATLGGFGALAWLLLL
jgi:hypothetical protein